VFALALHGQLLKIDREPFELLLIRQHRHGLCSEEIVVPDRQQTQEHRQVVLERGGTKVLVHLDETTQHGSKIVGADGHHGREPDSGAHRVAATDPIPKLEHVPARLLKLGSALTRGLFVGSLLAIIFEWPTIIVQKFVGVEENRLSVTLCE